MKKGVAISVESPRPSAFLFKVTVTQQTVEQEEQKLQVNKCIWGTLCDLTSLKE